MKPADAATGMPANDESPGFWPHRSHGGIWRGLRGRAVAQSQGMIEPFSLPAVYRIYSAPAVPEGVGIIGN